MDLVGADLVYSGMLDGVVLASIGPVTTGTLQELNLPVAIQAKEYTIPGLVAAIVEHFTALRRPTGRSREQERRT